MRIASLFFLLLGRIFLNGTWLPLWSACDVVLRLPVCSLPSLAGSMRAKSLRGNVLFCRNSADKPQYDGNFPASGGLRTIPKVRHRRLAVGGVFCPPRLLFFLNENNIFNKSCAGFFVPTSPAPSVGTFLGLMCRLRFRRI